MVASGSNKDKTVRLRDVASRQQTAVLPGYNGAFHSVAFLPDGRVPGHRHQGGHSEAVGCHLPAADRVPSGTHGRPPRDTGTSSSAWRTHQTAGCSPREAPMITPPGCGTSIAGEPSLSSGDIGVQSRAFGSHRREAPGNGERRWHHHVLGHGHSPGGRPDQSTHEQRVIAGLFSHGKELASSSDDSSRMWVRSPLAIAPYPPSENAGQRSRLFVGRPGTGHGQR